MRVKSGHIHEYTNLFSWKILLLICQKFGLKPQWPRTPIDRLEDATTTTRLAVNCQHSWSSWLRLASHNMRRLILIRIETSEINSRQLSVSDRKDVITNWETISLLNIFTFTLHFRNADYSVFPTDKHIFALTMRACM